MNQSFFQNLSIKQGCFVCVKLAAIEHIDFEILIGILI